MTLGLLALYWVAAALVVVSIDLFLLRNRNPYLACSIMHAVVAGVIGGHLAFCESALSHSLPFWLEVGLPFACAFFVMGCLSLSRRHVC
ncbi:MULTISPECIES: hypothetical protein [Pseudomonas]|uniref:hypothetical protein n=1 Tax=Pseudomonas TaxID=286 RepID=UPI0013CEF448|nr:MULTISPECIES: hypothetical protein [Pseudomonas]MBD8614798.1 hypothetical protein [Pseudomonas putida]MBD8681518.1 hypothetical protein [Pseudomonas sp. CFBP 13719]